MSDDTLMVTLHLFDYLVKRILVDNESSSNLLFLTAFEEMDLIKEQLSPNIITVVGFNGEQSDQWGRSAC